LFNNLEINLKELHSVEMVGDAVRTPIIQQLIKDYFGLEVSKTLAPDETIARGATLFVIYFF
jgi:molecular chaperone DnaK (HSP70)